MQLQTFLHITTVALWLYIRMTECGNSPCSYLTVHNISSLRRELKQQVLGPVAAPWDAQYEEWRALHNPACSHKPLLIHRPWSDKDVSRCVQFSLMSGLPLSVRSGGHSYTCTSIKDGGLHLDLRDLNKVRLVKTYRSPSGLAAILGPGSDWGRVVDIIPWDRYTVVHGQCLGVGVGGFILGGGINALGATVRHGWGAENVLQMRVVLADSRIATVTSDQAVIENEDGTETEYKYTKDTDLWFALRGAGSSFGIVTEFLYTVHPRPETRPIVLPIRLETVQDFANLERAAHGTKRFLLSVYTTRRYTDGLWPYNLLPYRLPYSSTLGGKHLLLINQVIRVFGMPPMMGARSSSVNIGSVGILLIVTEVQGPSGQDTDPGPAINYLKYRGVRLTIDSPGIVRILSRISSYLVVNKYEDGFLTPQEQRILGNLNIASAAMYGMKDSLNFAEVMLQHPVFGERGRYTAREVNRITGCDFCWFSFNFDNHLRFRNYSRVAINPEFGVFQWDFSCLFRNPASKCPQAVRDLKRSLSADSVPKISQFQYANTPSCEDIDFGERYWGSHYPQLCRIKQWWDPGHVFHHCHSVGSAEQHCCPY